MQKQKYSKLGLIACIAVLAASIHVHADMASASGILADIAASAAEANNALAAAANSGDPAAIEAAQAVVNDVKTASQSALDAYAALEQGDATAEQDLRDAQAAAQVAIGEEPRAELPATANARARLKNPNAILWQSDGLQILYEELFNIVQSASAQGGAEFSETETDATNI